MNIASLSEITRMNCSWRVRGSSLSTLLAHSAFVLGLTIALAFRPVAKAEDVRVVNNEWTWFTDYVYAYATWTLNAEAGCECEVGMGIKAFGKPRGEKRKFRDHVTFTTLGFGAIHVRTLKPHVECRVRLDQGDVGVVTIYSSGN